MNLSCLWWELNVKERLYIIDVVGVYSWGNLPINHPVNQVFVRAERNKVPFFDILMVIKAIEIYRLNNDEYSSMSQLLLKKLKKKLMKSMKKS